MFHLLSYSCKLLHKLMPYAGITNEKWCSISITVVSKIYYYQPITHQWIPDSHRYNFLTTMDCHLINHWLKSDLPLEKIQWCFNCMFCACPAINVFYYRNWQVHFQTHPNTVNLTSFSHCLKQQYTITLQLNLNYSDINYPDFLIIWTFSLVLFLHEY